MAVDFVRIELTKTDRKKLRFRHAELRNAVNAATKSYGFKASIGDLMGDPFGGWPILIAEGHRSYDPMVTLDKASEWINEFVSTPDPNTGKDRSLDDLGNLLLEAVKASKFIVIKPPDDDDAEGNAPPEVAN